MFVLDAAALKMAENILKRYFPESLKVYGCLFNINRGKPYIWEVIVDSWPEFRAIICRPKEQPRRDYRDLESTCNKYLTYAKDPESLINLLSAPGSLDWSQPALLEGVDGRHLDAVKELAVHKNVLTETTEVLILMTLEHTSQLQGPESTLACRLQPLTVALAENVNSVWTHGPNEINLNSLRSYISSYPSLCVMAEDGTLVSWVLMYHHGALGRLYTSPEHRRKGHARLLVSTMARLLLEQGRPVYGFVREVNVASLSLFTSLGFSHKPDYRSVWLQLSPK